jgi:hypothetical protein
MSCVLNALFLFYLFPIWLRFKDFCFCITGCNTDVVGKAGQPCPAKVEVFTVINRQSPVLLPE